MNIKDVEEFFKNLDIDYNLDYFNILLKELDCFAKINDLDLHINITDKVNHNTKLVIDMNE